MQDHEAIVQTSLGPLRLYVAGSATAHSEDGKRTRSAQARTHPFEVNRDDSQAVTINGKRYRAVRVDLMQSASGSWTLAADASYNLNGWHSLGGQGEGAYPDELTASARKYLHRQIVPELANYLNAHPELIAAADVAEADMAARSIRAKITEHEADLLTLRAKLRTVEAIGVAALERMVPA